MDIIFYGVYTDNGLNGTWSQKYIQLYVLMDWFSSFLKQIIDQDVVLGPVL